jgi:hypothetical protein
MTTLVTKALFDTNILVSGHFWTPVVINERSPI